MATARPSYYPDWATTIAVDPVSGVDNAIEPPGSWQTNGWGYQEKPPRNYDNWVKRYNGLWVRYLDEQMNTEQTTKDIWVDLIAHLDFAAPGDWIYCLRNPAVDPFDPGDSGGEACYKAQTVGTALAFEISDWPEGMTLNSAEIDWLTGGGGMTVAARFYVARQVWIGGGAAKTCQPLNSGYQYINHSSAGNRVIDTFTCDQNNTSWSHELHKLVIVIFASDPSVLLDAVYGVRLNVTYHGLNKWNTSSLT